MTAETGARQESPAGARGIAAAARAPTSVPLGRHALSELNPQLPANTTPVKQWRQVSATPRSGGSASYLCVYDEMSQWSKQRVWHSMPELSNFIDFFDVGSVCFGCFVGTY